MYDCVYCINTNIAANAIYYILSVYLPLFILFLVILLLNIKVTTGPANAFTLYCQVLSSTFDLNADRQVPVHLISSQTYPFLQTYRFIYGIFNLDFLESLLPPLCLRTHLNALNVLQLDYLVVFFPLLMIGWSSQTEELLHLLLFEEVPIFAQKVHHRQFPHSCIHYIFAPLLHQLQSCLILHCWHTPTVNSVNLLRFTNLTLLNLLSLYVFAYSQINSVQSLPVSVFALQGILVFPPLLYMIGYLLWLGICRYHTNIKKFLMRCMVTSESVHPMYGQRPSPKHVQ